MGTDMSIITLISNASVLVQLVMLLLLIASIASWTVIFKKRRLLSQANKESEAFDEQFWSGGDLASYYHQIKDQDNLTGQAALFVAGFGEFLRHRKQAAKRAPGEVVDSIRRAMRVQMTREIEDLEVELPFLATVGSTSPYVGLFGTVWGIMNSFRALGQVKQATLAMVAPGIAEALIATAMGLFAAIPAVVFFNTLVSQVSRIETRYEMFMEELVHILERHVHAGTEPAEPQ